MINQNPQLLAAYYKANKHQDVSETTLSLLKSFVETEYSKIPFAIKYVNYDPYNNFTEMLEGLLKDNYLKISMLNNESPIFDCETNLKFRAIHDYHHLICHAEFNFYGEYATFEYISALTDNDIIKQILFSEIVLQAAYALVYGEFGEQKLVLM